MDTTRIVGGTPVQTLFCLPTCLDKSDLRLIQDPVAYKPSTAESPAPFRQDPTQRIVGLDMPFSFGYLFLRAGALLELESREGSVVTWTSGKVMWLRHVSLPWALNWTPFGSGRLDAECSRSIQTTVKMLGWRCTISA